jgi:hypothetical protein
MPQVLIPEALEKFFTLSYHAFPFKLHNFTAKLQDNPIKETLESVDKTATILFLNDRTLESLKLNCETFNHFNHKDFKNNYGYNKKIARILDKVDKNLLDKSMEKAYLFVDEFDNLADPIKSELNYPIGIAKNIEKQEFTIKLCMEIADYLIKSDDSNIIDINQKYLEINEEGIQNINEYLLFKDHMILTSSNNDELNTAIKISIIGKCNSLNDIKDPLIKKIKGDQPDVGLTIDNDKLIRLRIAYHIINNLLTSIITKRYRVNYGLKDSTILNNLDSNNSEFNLLAVPYDAALTPSKNSLFTDVYLTIIFTCISFKINKTLRSNDVDLWLNQIKENFINSLGYIGSDTVAGNKYVSELNTTFGNFNFNSQKIGHNLLDFMYSIKDERKGSHKLLQDTDITTLENFMKEPENLDIYLTKIIFNAECKERSTQFNLSFMDIFTASFCKNRVGYTGTASKFIPIEIESLNTSEYSEKYCQDLDGAKLIKEALIDHCDKILIIDEETTSLYNKIEEEIKNYNALIDVGALLLHPEKEYFPNKYSGIFQGLPDKKNVIFWLGDDRYILPSTGGPKEKKIDKKADVKNFVFYDNEHITGTDFNHIPTAKAMVTINSDSRMRDVAQGVYRMRGINQSQKISYILTSITWKKFIRDYSEGYKQKYNIDTDLHTEIENGINKNKEAKCFIFYCFEQLEEEYREKQKYLYKLQVIRNYMRQSDINIDCLNEYDIDTNIDFGISVNKLFSNEGKDGKEIMKKFIVPIKVKKSNYKNETDYNKISYNNTNLYEKLNCCIIEKDTKDILHKFDEKIKKESSISATGQSAILAGATSVAQSSSMSVSLSLSLTQKYNAIIDLDKYNLYFENDKFGLNDIEGVETIEKNICRAKDINIIHEKFYKGTEDKFIYKTKGTILHNRYFNIPAEFYLTRNYNKKSIIVLLSGEEYIKLKQNFDSTKYRDLNHLAVKPKEPQEVNGMTPKSLMKEYYYFKLLVNISINKDDASQIFRIRKFTRVLNDPINNIDTPNAHRLKHNIYENLENIYVKDGSYLPLMPPYCGIFNKDDVNKIKNWSKSESQKINFYVWKFDGIDNFYNIDKDHYDYEVENDSITEFNNKYVKLLDDNTNNKYVKIFYGDVNNKYLVYLTGPDNNIVKIFKNKKSN